MKITPENLIAWQTTSAFQEWFLSYFSDGEAEYQTVLNTLAADDRSDDAHWLMDKAGVVDDSPLYICGFEAHKHVFAASVLIVSGGMSVSGWIRAGANIQASQSLNADCGVMAGSGIKTNGNLTSHGAITAGGRIDAGRNIQAGESIIAACGIVAGGDIRAGKNIHAGKEFEAMTNALDAIFSDDAGGAYNGFNALAMLWSASGGTHNIFDAVVGDLNVFGLMAAGEVTSGENIISATTINIGESIMAMGCIQAGQGVNAGGSVNAGQSIDVGQHGITAGGGIRVGGDINAASISTQAGIDVGGNVDVLNRIKSSANIRVGGNIDVGKELTRPGASIEAKFEIHVSGDCKCNGTVCAGCIEVDGVFLSMATGHVAWSSYTGAVFNQES